MGSSGGYSSIIMIVLMLVIFYLFLILPENKKKKKLNEMRSNLKVGDDIVTIGGMMGKVVHVTDDSVTFETSEDQVRIQVAKWAISTNARAEAQAAKEAQERNGLPSRKRKKRKRKSRSTRSRRAPRCKAAFGMIHLLQEYAVMHTFCRGCFFEYGTKMVADALAHGGSCPDRTWAHAAVELAGCVCDELRTAAGGRGAACGTHLLCARVLSGRRILAAAGAGEGAWWSHDVGNVGDRISHSESGCRSADFLRRYRRYAADHAGCRNRWFVHFS